MTCARCDQPMTRAEAEPFDVAGNSGGGWTVWVHKKLCPLPDTKRTT